MDLSLRLFPGGAVDEVDGFAAGYEFS